MKKAIFTLFILASYIISADAQFVKTPLFNSNDAINLRFIPNNGYYYYHKIEKGNTVYSISRAFDVPVKNINYINSLTSHSTLTVGKSIKIPVDPTAIYQGADVSVLNGSYVAVYYTVRAQETLFRIAKMYFNQPVEALKAKNNLYNNDLDIGQELLIGWLPLHGTELPQEIIKAKKEQVKNEVITYRTPVSATTQNYTSTTTTTVHSADPNIPKKVDSFTETKTVVIEPTSSTITQVNTETSNKILTAQENITTQVKPVTVEDSVYSVVSYPVGFRADLLGSKSYNTNITLRVENNVAHWDKTIPDNGVAYALHNTAIPNTYIELYNPNLKRSIRAKVIGKIPFGTYTSDVELVLSPRAAKLLGGLDQRFRVETKYLK